MIESLYIKDFVLIDELNIDFSDGLTTLTGETGAGKSLIVDALELLKGKRASNDYIRKGQASCTLEAVITLSNLDVITRLGLEDIVDDNQIIVTRILKDNGKSLTKLNHRAISNSDVQKILDKEISITAQKAQNVIMDSRNHRYFVDAFGNLFPLLQDYQQAYQDFIEKQNYLDRLKEKQFNPAHIEFMESQVAEIEALNIDSNQYDEMLKEAKRMEVMAKDMEKIQNITTILDQLEIGSIYDLAKAMQKVDDELIQENSSKLMDIYYELDGISDNIQDYIHNLSFDEAIYNDLQTQLMHIKRVINKYGNKFSDMLEAYEQMQAEISLYHNNDEVLVDSQKARDQAYDIAYQKAQKLSDQRHQVASKLANRLNVEIQDLCLDNASLKVAVEEVELNTFGIDKINLMVSMNKNQDFTPLEKSASGGEQNRLLLAISTVLAQYSGISTMVYDEIDSGVSGNVAFAIGKKMHELAQHCQVFNITHLAPVACFADQHYLVRKYDNQDETLSDLQLLDESGRINELASITSGTIDEKSIEVAKGLLSRAKEV